MCVEIELLFVSESVKTSKLCGGFQNIVAEKLEKMLSLVCLLFKSLINFLELLVVETNIKTRGST